jgi:hypothetical protein
MKKEYAFVVEDEQFAEDAYTSQTCKIVLINELNSNVACSMWNSILKGIRTSGDVICASAGQGRS